MNPQARKIWDALNPKIEVSALAVDEFQFDTVREQVFAVIGAKYGIRAPMLPTEKMCLDAVRGSHTLILASLMPNFDINETLDKITGRRYLAMRPVMLAWVVGRAASAISAAGTGAVDRYINELRQGVVVA